jgi:hypothetical protein
LSNVLGYSRAQHVEHALDVAKGDIALGWLQLTRALNLDEATGSWVLGRYDLSSSAGWIEAGAATRDRIVETAIQYLRSMPSVSPNSACDEHVADAGFRAVILVKETNAAALDQISGPEWHYWLPGLAQAASNAADPAPFQRVVAHVYERYAKETLEALEVSLSNGHPVLASLAFLAGVDAHWDDAIADIVANAGNNDRLPAHLQGQLLSNLLRHGDPRGSELAARLRAGSAGSERAITAGCQVLLAGAAPEVAELVSILKEDHELAKAVFSQVAVNAHQYWFPSDRIPNHLVSDLYLLALELFPVAEDPQLIVTCPHCLVHGL